jgi:SAM-dependent methyltransferase
MNDDFYRKFEEQYYAPREVIRELRLQYMDFVEPLSKIYPGEQTFDAGCGRGEWLEIMGQLGFLPHGVDLDEGMLSDCKVLKLNAIYGDAIKYIKELPNNSQVIVSAFHVVEHISFDQLRVFISEALRVLKDGGLLIMETPNPENIVVSTRNFYLDPTHIRPIPSELLKFVTQNTGFEKIKTLRLQESKFILDQTDVRLMDVFNGASPDYAIVAQKSARQEILSKTERAFSHEYGISSDEIISRWDVRFENLVNIVDETKIRTEGIEERYSSQLDAIYSSTSWKITAPMRRLVRFLKKLKHNE